ncbi:MAG: beta-ketoacyl synthase N-terminal-like domain-containing protein [Coleofasciculus sp. C1-SOL-03]|uniref:beta-ketoacyl synthase N-terminal-like domain-containing protein n=1 Tax=Coleofasciculus sp. C1-SOL-03 TaxID=3069522 RepID=UPI0032F7B880
MKNNTSLEKEPTDPTPNNPQKWQSQLHHTPIAIIGMASIFPQARNLQEYWQNIIHKTDGITDVPPSRWHLDDYYDPDPTVPDKTYSKRGGFIPDIAFNPLEFGLPPNSLEATDIAQLLSLVVAKAAMDDAGYGESRPFSRERTGVILGVVGGSMQLIVPLTTRLQYPVWEKVLKSSGLSDTDTQKIIEKIKLAYVGWQENSFPGWLANVVAGRIANRLNLGGINCVVDAACASSLSALKMAISELVEGRCDLMITGGVETDNSMLTYMSFSKTPAFSKKQQCRPFDADADGMMASEGIGMVVLKRLADAERDGDRIYAVIKGIGTSSDGRYKSIYAPRPEGQVNALRRAYQDAGCPPSSVGLIEAHGTGTVAGDLCEFTALNQVFSENNPHQQQIALGSVKSQIGHAKAAAGAASLIKTALALHHQVLPPMLNVTQPNPKFGIETSPFYLNTQTRPWLKGKSGTPRRAGVSAFGFGGTNYHVVLEEYEQEQSSAYRLHTVPQSILLSAPTPDQVLATCETVRSQLESETGDQYYTALLDSCKSLDVPITDARLGFVATSFGEACQLLQIAIHQLKNQPQAPSWEHPRGIYYRQNGIPLQGKVVALFPGQGSQYLEMGRQLAINFPPLRQAYSAVDDLFLHEGLPPLSSVVFPSPAFESHQKTAQIEALQQTQQAQPAIGAFSVGLYKILQQAGFKPDFVAGHSFGELTALWAAEVLSDADYFYLIKARGQAMGATTSGADCDTGTMLAVNGDVRNIQDMIRGLSHLSIANFNSPNQVVLSGAKPEIATVQEILSKRGYSVTPLPVSAAFHTRFVSHASQPFAEAVRSVTFNPPKIPVYANTTGEPYPIESEAIQNTLEAHLLKSVLFEQEIENLYAAGGYCFVEIGPRQILTNLVKSILGNRPHLAIALNPSREKDSDLQLRQALLQLRVAGLPLPDFDPYSLEPTSVEAAGNNRQMSVILGGCNYITPKTKAAFEQALQDGHRIESSLHQSEPIPAAQSMAPKTPTPNTDLTVAEPPLVRHREMISSPSPELITVNFNSHELHTHDNPVSASFNPSPSLTDVMDTEPPHSPPDRANFEDSTAIVPIIHSKDMLQPISQSPAHAQHGITPSLEKLLTQFYHHQSEILRVHEQYLNNQAQWSVTFLQMIQQPGVMSTDNHTEPQGKEVMSEVGSTNGKQGISNHSETTALNSIPQTTFPSDAAIAESPIRLAEHQTQNLTPVAAESDLNEGVVSPPAESLETVEVTPSLLNVVSDKTGYPPEMLELQMDLEADLGIDSIKRVEIIGAMQELFPELPKLSPDELAEQRTLGKIADYLGTQIARAKKKCLTPA